MHRRTLLVTAAGGAAVLAGCTRAGIGTTDSVGGETTIRTESLSIEQGEQGTTSVVAANVKMVHGGIPRATSPGTTGEGDVAMVKFNAATITPSPSGAMDSYPPYWTWNSLQGHVEITLPIHILSETPAGTYRSTMSGWQSTEYSKKPAASEEILITVGETTTPAER